jgi:retron-type reverse transcriptase
MYWTNQAPQFTKLFNSCIDTGKFPDDAKLAQVTPIFKKEDPLNTKNYRPVSILTTTSKVLEKVMEIQMKDWLDSIYNESLAAFRQGFSCQHVLLALCEKWRDIREAKSLPGLLLVDLSKAFDCLPHSLIIAKLKTYGVEDNSVNLLANYLSNRKQRVKVSGVASTWTQIFKGVPQGSILGPTIFNIFMNDIFCAIKDGTLFNYATILWS